MFLETKDLVGDDFDDLRTYAGEPSNSAVIKKLAQAYKGELTFDET